jgi:hypothetical protein
VHRVVSCWFRGLPPNAAPAIVAHSLLLDRSEEQWFFIDSQPDSQTSWALSALGAHNQPGLAFAWNWTVTPNVR